MRVSIMRASFVLATLLAPFALAAPSERSTKSVVKTPHGDRPASNVHEIPKGP